MAISSTIDERRKALLARIKEPPEPNMEVFGQIKKMLNAVFGEENNQILRGIQEDIQIYETRMRMLSSDIFRTMNNEVIWANYVGNAAEYSVVIRFPTLTITNDSHESHEIVDLWVRFDLTAKGHVSNLDGVRTSITPEEQLAQYRHSHLSRSSGSGWSTFCLGSGPLAVMIRMMSNSFKPEQFQLFLLNIKEYVKWESISGTPYIRMNNIKNRTGSINQDITTILSASREGYINFAFEFIKGLQFDVLIDNVCVTLEEGLFNVRISDKLENWLTTYFNSEEVRSRRINLSSFLCYKNTDGKYVSGALADVVLPHQNKPTLIFKGEPQFLKIINKEENVKETTKYLHPVFKHELEVRLTNYFNTSQSAYTGA